MAINTTIQELKDFFNDEEAWPEGFVLEHCRFSCKNKEFEELEDIIEMNGYVPSLIVTILYGYLDHEDGTTKTLSSVFKKWRSKKENETLIVQVPKQNVIRIKEALKELGGKVLN